MKTALITGASTGIGYEMAIHHAKQGGDLIVVARNEHKLIMLKNLVESQYKVKCEVIPMDLSDEYAAKHLMDEVSVRKITVDYLINNAGVGFTEKFADTDLGTLQQMVQLNVMTLMNLTHYFIKDKLEKGEGGKILNVASTAAFQGIPYMSVYAASKAFVLSFTEGLAMELKGSNISVTALCPGPTKSNFGSAANLDERMSNFPLLPAAASVAKYGYDKMLSGEVVAIHGVMNRIGANATKVVGRKTVGSIAGEIFKRVTK